MPVSGNPDAGSYAQQGKTAPNARSMSGAIPPGRIRARVTATDSASPANFTWIEVEPTIDGSLVDKLDGLRGESSFNPLREVNGQAPPFYPWFVWAEPTGDFGDKGTLWTFDLKCCTTSGDVHSQCNPPCDTPKTLFATFFNGVYSFPSGIHPGGNPPDFSVELRWNGPVLPGQPNVWINVADPQFDNPFAPAIPYHTHIMLNDCSNADCTDFGTGAVHHCAPDEMAWNISATTREWITAFLGNSPFCWPCTSPVNMQPTRFGYSLPPLPPACANQAMLNVTAGPSFPILVYYYSALYSVVITE